MNHHRPTPSGPDACGISLVLSLVFLLTSGCAHSPQSFYSSLPQWKTHFESMALITDFALIEGLMNDTNKIDLIQNRRLASALLTMCADSLSLKGYPVRKTSLTSIGLLMTPGIPFRVVRATANRHLDSEDLPIGHPPFYLDSEFVSDTIREQLRGLYLSLLSISQRGERDSVVLPEAVPVGKELGCGTITVLLVGAFNTPVSKAIGKPTPNTSGTLGVVTLESVSQLSVMLFMVDASSGTVLWDDKKYMSGGVIFPEKILGAAGDLLTGLP